MKQTMELIHLITGENPLQVIITAISQGGAREDSTRIGSGGVVRRQAVDVSPLRRVNQAIYLICKGSRESAFRSTKSISETLADEFINAAKVSIKIFNRFVFDLDVAFFTGHQWQLICREKEGRNRKSGKG
jgi:small subunit ribosomal protein S5e